MTWSPVGKYAIRNARGYTICKTFDAGKALYSGWAPRENRAFIHAHDAAAVKAACDKHHEETGR